MSFIINNFHVSAVGDVQGPELTRISPLSKYVVVILDRIVQVSPYSTHSHYTAYLQVCLRSYKRWCGA